MDDLQDLFSENFHIKNYQDHSYPFANNFIINGAIQLQFLVDDKRPTTTLKQYSDVIWSDD